MTRTLTCQLCKRNKPRDELHKNGGHNTKRGYVQYYSCNPCATVRLQDYRQTEKGKRVFASIRKRQDRKFPEKLKARGKLNYALKTGDVVRPKRCKECRKNKPLDAHHPDYNNPLDVVWVCRGCHLKTYH